MSRSVSERDRTRLGPNRASESLRRPWGGSAARGAISRRDGVSELQTSIVEEEKMRSLSITRRVGVAAAALAAAAFALPGFAGAQGIKGKTVEYIAFGLQFEYQ